MSKAVLDALSLDEVWVIPAGNPPHKDNIGATARQRLDMARLAVRDIPRFKAIDIEAMRGGVTYTVDTLHSLAPLGHDYTFITGSDTLHEIRTWKNSAEVMRMTAFAVILREGGDEGAMYAEAERLNEEFDAHITFVREDIQGISSTEIRERVRAGLSCELLVPQSVQDYIDANRLYNPPPQLTRGECEAKLQGILSGRRFAHSLAVERRAIELAKEFDADIADASTAGLLHDCAKELPLDVMRSEAVRLGIPIDPIRFESGDMLHGPVGAALMRERFGVTNPAILHAVKVHDTLSVPMSALDKILYLADKSCDGRSFSHLDAIRELSKTDLDRATLLAHRHADEYYVGIGLRLHPDQTSSMNELVGIVKDKEYNNG
jgi:nicotinate-nucleotide adenylyltransferase